mgnify:FL=1
MTRVVLLPSVEEDLERIMVHLETHDSQEYETRIAGIAMALEVLSGNPMIGRGLYDDVRELVIGRDARGYMAMYRYSQAMDCVFVMGIRAQREAGYARELENKV